MHASSGTRTHDPSVCAGEDISCPRLRDYCDRRHTITIKKYKMKPFTWCHKKADLGHTDLLSYLLSFFISFSIVLSLLSSPHVFFFIWTMRL
jgi:hypothetical protein